MHAAPPHRRAHQGMGTYLFTQLDAWVKARELVLATYRVTEAYPPKELFRLTDQSCRAAVSVAGNIAEGYGRRKPRDKMRFYNHSEVSLQELRCYFILAQDLGYLEKPESLFKLIVDVESMLRKLNGSIERSLPSPRGKRPPARSKADTVAGPPAPPA